MRLHNPETNGRGAKVKAALLREEQILSAVQGIEIKGAGHACTGSVLPHHPCPRFLTFPEAGVLSCGRGGKVTTGGARLSGPGYTGTLISGSPHFPSKPPCSSSLLLSGCHLSQYCHLSQIGILNSDPYKTRL